MKRLGEKYRDRDVQFLVVYVREAHPGERAYRTYPQPRDFRHCRVALVGTAGGHLHGDRPFDVRNPLGDTSFRVIPGDVPLDKLRLSHPGYNTRKIQQDINCVFPLERLRELAQEGIIGGVSPRHFSFMGYIPIPDLLIEKTAPEVATLLREDQVDLALLVPA